MNTSQYYFDLSLYNAVSSRPPCSSTAWTMPVSANYKDDSYVWDQEVQAINCLSNAGQPIPTYPVMPNPDPARQQAIQRWSVDEKLWANALTVCFATYPKPDLNDYIADPNYTWPWVEQASQCQGNSPAR